MTPHLPQARGPALIACTLQPTARRAWSSTTVESSTAATNLVSSRTTGQRVNTRLAADRARASPPKSHCSHGTGMSHRTWGRHGQLVARPSTGHLSPPPSAAWGRTYHSGNEDKEGVAVDAHGFQEGVRPHALADPLPPPQEGPQRQRHQPNVAVDGDAGHGHWGAGVRQAVTLGAPRHSQLGQGRGLAYFTYPCGTGGCSG